MVQPSTILNLHLILSQREAPSIFGKKDDPQAKAAWLKGLVTDHQVSLTRFARSLMGNEEAAQDVVQETFLKLWNEPMSDLEGRERAWLFTVCRNACYDRLRKKQRHLSKVDDVRDYMEAHAENVDAEEALSRQAESDEMSELIGKLKPQEIEVLRLKFQESMSYKEIATVTGKTVNHVGVIIHQAIKRLQELRRKREKREGARFEIHKR